jgi:superfamily I DNA/RNA helicase
VADEAAASVEEHREAGSRRGIEVLRALVDELVVDHPTATVGDLEAWLAATDAARTGDVDPTGDGRVDVSTFHRAKGLEWRAVAIVGLEDGLVPIAYATSHGARNEERRLLYVAITRAEDDLWCSWARSRHLGDRTWRCEPSPMLAPLEQAIGRGAVGTDPDRVSLRLQELRRRLADVPG